MSQGVNPPKVYSLKLQLSDSIIRHPCQCRSLHPIYCLLIFVLSVYTQAGCAHVLGTCSTFVKMYEAFILTLGVLCLHTATSAHDLPASYGQCQKSTTRAITQPGRNSCYVRPAYGCLSSPSGWNNANDHCKSSISWPISRCSFLPQSSKIENVVWSPLPRIYPDVLIPESP